MKINNDFSFNSKPQVILLCCLGLFFAGQNVTAMDLPAHKDMVFVYEQRSTHVLPVEKDVYMLSGYIKSLIEGGIEFGLEGAERKIQLDFSFDDIKSAFKLIEIYLRQKNKREDVEEEGLEKKALEKFIQGYKFDHLIGIANCIDYLMCPLVIKKVCLQRIKELADKSDKNLFSDPYFGANLQQLSLSLQESLFLKPSISNLKNIIINLYKDRKIELKKHKGITSIFNAEVYSVDRFTSIIRWSPDETKICISAPGKEFNEVNLWSVADQKNITYQPILQVDANSIVFSSDGQKIMIDNSSNHSIDIWDIAAKKIVNRINNNQGIVSKSIFSQDGTKLFSTTFQENVISSFRLIDLTNGTSKTISHEFHYLDLPVMSHGGTVVAMIAIIDDSFFVALFDITDLDNITLLKKIPVIEAMESIAFSPNDRKIVCTIENGYKLCILDISNLNNITRRYLKTGNSDESHFQPAEFTPDGENIVVAGESTRLFPKLGLWDINEDLEQFTFYNLGIGRAVAVAPSFTQGCRIAYLGHLPIIQKLWTHEETVAFDTLKGCNVDQMRLVYSLSLRAINNREKEIELGEHELPVFQQLPQNVQQVLARLLNIRKRS